MSRVIGIDLGTTNSVAAVMEGGQPTVITLAEGSRLCPSVVGFSKSGERLIGQIAKRQAVSNPDRTIRSIKRYMGTDHRVPIDDRQYTPQQISSFILHKLKQDAEAYLGHKVEQAVITVPAYFSDAQRQATKDAGTLAGLEVLRIINEPTAAALAYGIEQDEVHTVLVWDLGGGTFDVSILELDDGVFEVRATCGDTQLGGDDWDQRIVDWLLDEYRRETRVDLRRDKSAMQRLREAAEKAKIELTSNLTSNINLPFISANQDGPVHLEMDLTRARFELMTSDLLERMVAPTRQALSDAGLSIDEVDRILLVGGSTRMPAVQALARRLFETEPVTSVNPDEAVAVGAAVQAAVLSGEVEGVLLLDVTPLSLGIETLGGVFTKLIDRNTTIPTQRREVFSTAADGQTAVDVKIYQGEREIASYNRYLGNLKLDGIPRAPRGTPKIEVTFDIDANGILHVTAMDQQSGRAQSVSLTAATGLTKEDIHRMLKEAEESAPTDTALTQARIEGTNGLAECERIFSELRTELPQEDAYRLQLAMAGAAATLNGDDAEAIREAVSAVRRSLEALRRPPDPGEPA
jgi:molecular chaperone DnaK